KGNREHGEFSGGSRLADNFRWKDRSPRRLPEVENLMKHIALIKDGEPFPVECSPYSLRVGNLAAELAERGHKVSWHASTFSHYKREHLNSEQVNVEGQTFHI